MGDGASGPCACSPACMGHQQAIAAVAACASRSDTLLTPTLQPPHIASPVPAQSQSQTLQAVTLEAHGIQCFTFPTQGALASSELSYVQNCAGVCAGELPAQVETVWLLVYSDQSSSSKQQTQSMSPSDAAASACGRVDLDVNVEYVAGCKRSHAARLSIHVSPPFR